MKIDLTDNALIHDHKAIWSRVFIFGVWTPFMRKNKYRIKVPRDWEFKYFLRRHLPMLAWCKQKAEQ